MIDKEKQLRGRSCACRADEALACIRLRLGPSWQWYSDSECTCDCHNEQSVCPDCGDEWWAWDAQVAQVEAEARAECDDFAQRLVSEPEAPTGQNPCEGAKP